MSGPKNISNFLHLFSIVQQYSPTLTVPQNVCVRHYRDDLVEPPVQKHRFPRECCHCSFASAPPVMTGTVYDVGNPSYRIKKTLFRRAI